MKDGLEGERLSLGGLEGGPGGEKGPVAGQWLWGGKKTWIWNLGGRAGRVDGQEAEFGDGQNWVDRNLKLNCGPRQLLSERPVVSSGGRGERQVEGRSASSIPER